MGDIIMAYGKIYIADLSKKATDLFNELIDAKKLNEKEFISSFKEKYPKDYDLLVYEWEFKVHAFKKNKKRTSCTSSNQTRYDFE